MDQDSAKSLCLLLSILKTLYGVRGQPVKTLKRELIEVKHAHMYQ